MQNMGISQSNGLEPKPEHFYADWRLLYLQISCHIKSNSLLRAAALILSLFALSEKKEKAREIKYEREEKSTSRKLKYIDRFALHHALQSWPKETIEVSKPLRQVSLSLRCKTLKYMFTLNNLYFFVQL